MNKYAMGRYGNRWRRRRAAPTSVQGAPGFSVIGGQVIYQEQSRLLQNRRSRWRTFDSILTNTSIVAAGSRFYTDLLKKSVWTFEPSEADSSGEFAERAERMITKDPITFWPEVVAQIGMFKFYGFSVHEWIVREDDEGYGTFDDISIRPGHSIYGWDVDERGRVRGVIQQDPQTHAFNYMSLDKLVYVADRAYSSSPEGLGLLRQLVEPCQRLEKYEQLEGWGHDLDLRGMPVIRTPREELKKQGKTEAEIEDIEWDLRDLAQNHSYNPERGVVISSAVYRTDDEREAPSNVPKWNVELLQGQARSHAEIAAAISRINHEAARTMSVDQLLLGEGLGSYALSRDKTQAFHLMINSALDTIRDVVEDRLVGTLWMLNGWDDALKPEIITSTVDHKDIYQLATAYRDIGMAVATLPPSAIEQWFALAGIELDDDAILDLEVEEGPPEEDLDEPMPDEAEVDKALEVLEKAMRSRGRTRSHLFIPKRSGLRRAA